MKVTEYLELVGFGDFDFKDYQDFVIRRRDENIYLAPRLEFILLTAAQLARSYSTGFGLVGPYKMENLSLFLDLSKIISAIDAESRINIH